MAYFFSQDSLVVVFFAALLSPGVTFALILPPYLRIQNRWRTTTLEKSDGILRGDHPHLRARFDRSGPQMRRKDNVVAPQTIADQRLALVYIKRRACDDALIERLDQRRLLDDRTAGCVNQKGRVLHHPK